MGSISCFKQVSFLLTLAGVISSFGCSLASWQHWTDQVHAFPEPLFLTNFFFFNEELFGKVNTFCYLHFRPSVLSLSLSFTLTLTHNHTQTTHAHFFHFLSFPSLNCSFHRTHTFTISFKLSLIHSPSPAHSFILSLILLSCSYIRIFSLLLSPLSPRNFSPFLPRVFLSHTHFTFTQSLAQFSLSFVASPIKAELQFPHLQLSLNDDDLRLSDSSIVLRQFSGK